MDDETAQRKSLNDFERPRLDNPFYLENQNPHGFGTDPSDGLPRPMVMADMETTKAAELNPKRFVCMKSDETGREQCKNYVRQLLPSSHDSERVTCVRYCTALRDENGEAYSLNDQEVLACEFRDPPDWETNKLLDEFDEEIMRRQREQADDEVPFDPLAAIEEMKNGK